MVIRRGKLHNPVTDTGGLVMGVVEEIGAEYDNREGLKTGDLIIDVYKRQSPVISFTGVILDASTALT